jgi:hypothetical protein
MQSGSHSWWNDTHRNALYSFLPKIPTSKSAMFTVWLRAIFAVENCRAIHGETNSMTHSEFWCSHIPPCFRGGTHLIEESFRALNVFSILELTVCTTRCSKYFIFHSLRRRMNRSTLARARPDTYQVRIQFHCDHSPSELCRALSEVSMPATRDRPMGNTKDRQNRSHCRTDLVHHMQSPQFMNLRNPSQ